MAKNNETAHGSSRAYWLTALMLTITTILNGILVGLLYSRTVAASQKSSITMSTINSLNSQLLDINSDVLLFVSGSKGLEATQQNVDRKITNFDKEADTLTKDQLSKTASNRYDFAIQLFDGYKVTINELYNAGDSTTEEGLKKIAQLYNNEVYPFQIATSEMFNGTIDIASNETGELQKKGFRLFIAIEIAIVGIYLLSLLAVYFMAKAAKKSQEALAEREKNLAEVDAKLKSTRQRASDLALSNLLTGTKNRYALTQDLTPRLESDRFNIAVFDMDNFRSINDTYGYEFGDEYLATVAEMLKEQFSSIAEIYCITGNEFCFLFNRDISENQAMAHAQNIRNVMASPFNIMNLSVQLTVSGAVYHYLPGDCLNVNSLLVKLDTAMRNVKLNGGNMITSVMNI